MYVEILDKTLLIREWLNGSLLPLTANLTLMIGVHLMSAAFESRRTGRAFRALPGVPTAFVLFWLFLAETVRAGSVWFSLRAQNSGRVLDPASADAIDGILVLCGLVLITAVLRATYLFTPPRIRRIFWIYSLLATVAFVAIVRIFFTRYTGIAPL